MKHSPLCRLPGASSERLVAARSDVVARVVVASPWENGSGMYPSALLVQKHPVLPTVNQHDNHPECVDNSTDAIERVTFAVSI